MEQNSRRVIIQEYLALEARIIRLQRSANAGRESLARMEGMLAQYPHTPENRAIALAAQGQIDQRRGQVSALEEMVIGLNKDLEAFRTSLQSRHS